MNIITGLPLLHKTQSVPDLDIVKESVPPPQPLLADPHCQLHLGN